MHKYFMNLLKFLQFLECLRAKPWNGNCELIIYSYFGWIAIIAPCIFAHFHIPDWGGNGLRAFSSKHPNLCRESLLRWDQRFCWSIYKWRRPRNLKVDEKVVFTARSKQLEGFMVTSKNITRSAMIWSSLGETWQKLVLSYHWIENCFQIWKC